MAVRLSSEYVMGGFTSVDNIFICEYMKNAPDTFVKVYIYGLYLAGSSIKTDISDFLLALGLSEEEVLSAYRYFAEFGLCDVLSENPLDVVYLPISNSPVRPRKIKEGKYDDFNKHLQSIITDRMITPNEYMEYYNLLELYHIQPEAFLVIARYCTSLQGGGINSRYIITVAKNLAYRKITTLKGVEEEFKNYTKNSKQILGIMSALSVKRKIEVDDNEYYQKWQSLGFDDDALMAAAKSVKSGGMKKLDALISELYSYKKFSASEIADFAKLKRESIELAYAINKNLGVFYQSVDSEIERYISKWQSRGFSSDTLVEIAKICFVRSLRTLEAMDEYVDKFYKQGLLTTEAIYQYIELSNQKDAVIRRTLDVLGLTRKVNAYDRESYARFEALGATQELIEYAAELSKDKVSPYPYMLAVLTSFQKNNVRTVEEAKAAATTNRSADAPRAAKQPEKILTRDFSKEQIDAMFDSIDSFKVL